MTNIETKKTLLKVRNVKKFFNVPSGVLKAIDDISFDVNKGEIVGLIGESGSGKTTVGRCLIRLYNEYSGFVSFEDKVISGNKLNKKQKRFLNKNIQMIFQDPHASLNSQNNIYTILKEPLIVNKIMKEEYNDFFRDWKQVCQNFYFSFKEKAKIIEMENAIFHTNEARLYLSEWENIINRIKFKFENIENDFNQYFSYLLADQNHESKVISKMFDNNSKLLNFYFKSQQEYRQNNILFYEKELKKAQELWDNLIELSKKSESSLQQENQIKMLENISKQEKNKFHEHRKNINNIIVSYLKEFKNDYQSYLDSAHSTTNVVSFNKMIKHYYIYKKLYHLLRKTKKDLLYLDENKIDELIIKMKYEKDQFLMIIEQKYDLNNKGYKKLICEDIKNNFDFDFKEFINKSKHKQEQWLDLFKAQKLNLENIKKDSPSTKYDYKPTNQEIEDAAKNYRNISRKNDEEIQIYAKDFIKRMNSYQKRIDNEHQELIKIREKLNEIKNLFDKKHKEFLEKLLNHLLAKNEKPKKIKSIIDSYENRVRAKIESLKSFKIEVANLKKDFCKLNHLLGITTNSFSKIYVKNILIKEKIYNSLEEVGLLRQFAWKYPHEFSGGQRQRIVIARALITNPKLIIADEPIASLDVSIQAQVVNILKDLCNKKNISMIFIAHDLSMVEYIADHILIMHLGKIVEAGETTEIYSNPLHPYTKNLFESIPKISNANKKFKAGNFDNKYLKEQSNENIYIDYFKVNDKHDLYCSIEQYKKWTKNKKPQLSRFTKQTNVFEQLK